MGLPIKLAGNLQTNGNFIMLSGDVRCKIGTKLDNFYIRFQYIFNLREKKIEKVPDLSNLMPI